MGRQVVEESVADEPVPESVSHRRGLDDQRGECLVEMSEGDVLGHAGERDELVGVERGADDGDTLEHLSSRGLDAGDHVRVEGLHPVRFGGSAASELVHREGDAAAERRDAVDLLGGRVGEVPRDQRRDIASPSGPSSTAHAPCRSRRLWRVSASVSFIGVDR